MILGAMNNPASSVANEIRRISDAGFSFVDLTSEPPSAGSDTLVKQKARILDALSTTKLKVVGHTAWYHEFANPYDSVREAHLNEFKASAKILSELGAQKVGIHPDPMAFAHKGRASYISKFIKSVVELDKYCADIGVVLLVETFEEKFLSQAELRKVFDEAPGARFNLDIGHANLNAPDGAAIAAMARDFGKELAHVHASDNDGKSDLHLPIGAGKIDWKKALGAIKAAGYDGAVTLEVFSPDQDYLEYSRKKFGKLWASAGKA